MAITAQYSFPSVPLSITNSDVDRATAYDVASPFSFLKFIKIVTVNYEPEVLQNYYSEYLKNWNLKTTQRDSENSGILIERYSDFLKEISIQFSTIHEKRFLSQLDFSDPYDLDIAISFYSKKLREIVQYYNKKRHDVKFELTRKKLVGSNYGVGKQIGELILDHLEYNDLDIVDYDLDAIKAKLNIKIEELYDTHTQYLNKTPNYKLYDTKALGFEDYGNVFLGDQPELQKQLFIGISDTVKELLEIPELVDNKAKLTEKYIGADVYYLTLSANSSSEYVVLTGKLYTANSPALNYLNRSYPTTASTFNDTTISEFDIGFFKPHKFSILTVNSRANTFRINSDVIDALVEPDVVKHFYFPDPYLYGSNTEVLTFVVDDSQFKHNISTGLAKNQPSTNDTSSSLYGYHTRNQIDFSYVFEQGYLDDIKQDIYGNSFGLVKNNNNFRKNVTVIEPTIIKNLILDGYEYYDELYNEGFAFNYDTADTSTYIETLRSGLSAYTNSFTQSNTAYYLSMRFFDPYEELIEPSENKQQFAVYDGAVFTFSDTEFLDDTVSMDDAAYDGTGTFYYNIALSGVPNFDTQWDEKINCGTFTTVFDTNVTLNDKNLLYIDSVQSPTVYTTVSAQIQTLNERQKLTGKLFVRNGATRQVKQFTEALPFITSKYSAGLANQLNSNLINFDLVYNTLFLQTSSYLVIEQLAYEDGEFIQSSDTSVTLQYNSNNFDKVSSRFKVKGQVYFYKLVLLENSLSATNNFILYPEIYKYDYINAKNEKIFPKNNTQLSLYTDLFNISGGDVRYLESSSPQITYNSTNDIFNISYLLKDQNKLPYLITHDFEYKTDVVFLSGNGYRYNNENYSYAWSVSAPSSIEFALSSGAYRTNTTEQELIL